MGNDLQAEPFCTSLLHEVADFNCGSDPWQVEVAQWIKDPSIHDCAVNWMKKGTQVWLYRTEKGELVGYGSLGKAKWNWPPPDGPSETVILIPSFGVRDVYQGEPKEGPREDRYAYQIMGDLIGRAQATGVQLLGLFVDPRNRRAITFYDRIGFTALSNTGNPYSRMFLELRSS